MILTDSGNGVQSPSWQVTETKAAGYSRVYYITGGQSVYTDMYVEKKLKIGNLYVFPSYLPYKIRHNPQDSIACLWFHMDLFPAVVGRLITFSPKVGDTLLHILMALMNEAVRGTANTQLYASLTEALADYICENAKLQIPDDGFSKILVFIRGSFALPDCTVEKLSEKFGYTPSHFIRVFRRNMNITPHQYITNLKMAEAVRLLLLQTPVSSVAKQVGYSDSKVFSHAFKQKFAIAPTKYKDYYRPMA